MRAFLLGLVLLSCTSSLGGGQDVAGTDWAAKIVNASNPAEGVTAAGLAAAARQQTAAGASQPAASAPRAAAGAFVTGRYRNLFREAGHSDQEIKKKIDAAFQQLFHGDPDTQAVFYWAGENGNGRLAYLSDINNRDVRSEGMSYGMMIAVQLDKKAEFDALWNWSRTYMYHESPAHPAYGLFSWYLMGLLHCSGQYRIWTPKERG
jgi:oligosaccharide reducing-end xylanase